VVDEANESRVDLREGLLAEPMPVFDEVGDRHGRRDRPTALPFERVDRQRSVGVTDARGLPEGAEEHSDRHLLPGAHDPPEDGHLLPASAEVSCGGEPVWARADDGDPDVHRQCRPIAARVRIR
jgi:hypothetical protein